MATKATSPQAFVPKILKQNKEKIKQEKEAVPNLVLPAVRKVYGAMKRHSVAPTDIQELYDLCHLKHRQGEGADLNGVIRTRVMEQLVGGKTFEVGGVTLSAERIKSLAVVPDYSEVVAALEEFHEKFLLTHYGSDNGRVFHDVNGADLRWAIASSWELMEIVGEEVNLKSGWEGTVESRHTHTTLTQEENDLLEDMEALQAKLNEVHKKYPMVRIINQQDPTRSLISFFGDGHFSGTQSWEEKGYRFDPEKTVQALRSLRR